MEDNQQQSNEQSPVFTPVTPDPVKPSHKKRNIILVLVAILLIAGGVGAGWLLFGRDEKPAPAQSSAKVAEIEKEEAAKTEKLSADLAKFIKPTTGETWYPQPKPIAKQNYFKEADFDTGDYYEVGERAGKKIIMNATVALNDIIYLFEKDAAGNVVVIAHPDTLATYNEQDDKQLTDQLKPAIKIDNTTHYDSLSIPREFEIDNKYNVLKSQYPNLGERLSNQNSLPVSDRTDYKTVKEYGGSKLTKTERKYSDTGLTSIGYQIITPLQTVVDMNYQPVALDSSGFQWSRGNGSAGASKFQPITRGCGGLSASVSRADLVKQSDLIEAGKTTKGQTVYEFSDGGATILQKAYEEFTDYAKDDKSIPNSGITKDDFIKSHGVIVVKDPQDQYLVYVGQELAPGYGCAKPVVYLYPTVPTSVNVKVGAEVKVSDPLYNPAAGWTAFAQPNGSLTVNGQPFDSLFWEGPGWGAYPAIDSGVIVPRSDVIGVIESQMYAQGMNAKETNDFLEYWKDKVPAKPYVRLTWLTTEQMNELAPLMITPKPDTVIRVFLDMGGLDLPTKGLVKQQFAAPERKGFTVTEWGGLSGEKLW